MTPYKPDTYTSVSPYLMVDGADAIIAFLKRVFGASELRRISGADGKVLRAEVRIDDTVVMLTDGDGGPAIATHVHVYVRDVDAAYRRALEAGATSVQAPSGCSRSTWNTAPLRRPLEDHRRHRTSPWHCQNPHPPRLARPGTAPIARAVIRSIPNGLIPARDPLPLGSSCTS